MPVPDYQTFMLPLLKLASDDLEHRLRDASEALADQFSLNESERNEKLPSGERIYLNRVRWARFYLMHANLLFNPERGIFKITEVGHQLLADNPVKIDTNVLRQFPSFRQFKENSSAAEDSKVDESPVSQSDIETTLTPEEILYSNYQHLQRELATDILNQVKSESPSLFEKLVVDLLVKMGYGGSQIEAGKAIGKSGDHGIDGVIYEDRLGLDVIYIQAKRYTAENATIGRPAIQAFVGALQGQNAHKGVFITTARYTAEAQEYAKSVPSQIILIDGQRLADLMIEYNVGVSVTSTYEVKQLNPDYFTDL